MNRKKINRLRFGRLLAAAAPILAASLLASGAGAATHKGAALELRQTALGRIVVDSRGRTLYMWSHDRRAKSSCFGACAKSWPPLVTRGKPRATMGARSALLGTTMRKDGKRQVTGMRPRRWSWRAPRNYASIASGRVGGQRVRLRDARTVIASGQLFDVIE